MFRFITLTVVLVLSCLTQTSCVSDAAAYSESLIELEHFISGQFLGRSRYVIKHKIDGNHEINVFDSSNNGISTNQVPEFKNLLSNNGLYRIQVVSKLENGESSSVSAAIPVCDLQQSGFKEDIVLHLDSNDNVISISYSSPVMAISQPCNANKVGQRTSQLLAAILLLVVISNNTHSILFYSILFYSIRMADHI